MAVSVLNGGKGGRRKVSYGKKWTSRLCTNCKGQTRTSCNNWEQENEVCPEGGQHTYTADALFKTSSRMKSSGSVGSSLKSQTLQENGSSGWDKFNNGIWKGKVVIGKRSSSGTLLYEYAFEENNEESRAGNGREFFTCETKYLIKKRRKRQSNPFSDTRNSCNPIQLN